MDKVIAWERYAHMLELRLWAGLSIAIPHNDEVRSIGSAPSIEYFHPGYSGMDHVTQNTMNRLASDRDTHSFWMGDSL